MNRTRSNQTIIIAVITLLAISLIASPALFVHAETYNCVTQWGSSGRGNGQFISPSCIAVDSSGNIYVADSGNDRVQVFSSTGTYISQFGFTGSDQCEFSGSGGIAIDEVNHFI